MKAMIEPRWAMSSPDVLGVIFSMKVARKPSSLLTVVTICFHQFHCNSMCILNQFDVQGNERSISSSEGNWNPAISMCPFPSCIQISARYLPGPNERICLKPAVSIIRCVSSCSEFTIERVGFAPRPHIVTVFHSILPF